MFDSRKINERNNGREFENKEKKILLKIISLKCKCTNQWNFYLGKISDLKNVLKMSENMVLIKSSTLKLVYLKDNKNRNKIRAGKIAQWVKMLAPKSDNLSFIPGTHMMQ